MALFLNTWNSADFDRFYLCSTFYYLMSSYNKKKNTCLKIENILHFFLGGGWGGGEGRSFSCCVLNETLTTSAPLPPFSFAYRVFSQQGSGMCVQEHKHKPTVAESPKETQNFLGEVL